MNKKILLHTCCAPCVLPILDYFKHQKMLDNVVLYFFNPNIIPKQEYDKRLFYVRKVGKYYNINVLEGEYTNKEWLMYLKNHLDLDLTSYKENGPRCDVCFTYRLEKSVLFAKQNNFDSFCTTLQVNLYKNTNFIIQKSKELCKHYGIQFIDLLLDKQEAHKKEKELCQKLDIYRQKFCGCNLNIDYKFIKNKNVKI